MAPSSVDTRDGKIRLYVNLARVNVAAGRESVVGFFKESSVALATAPAVIPDPKSPPKLPAGGYQAILRFKNGPTPATISAYSTTDPGTFPKHSHRNPPVELHRGRRNLPDDFILHLRSAGRRWADPRLLPDQFAYPILGTHAAKDRAAVAG